ncbi:MAG TPA: Fe-S cluster assembly protein SufD [Acidimicrobiia bacterium]|nr:Fe-S cluster assembly protein SufD [Acidimicrobiia bacterium]
MTAFDAESLNRIKELVPSWRASQMDAAFEVFESLDEPTGAEEDWRYVDYDLPFASLVPTNEPGPPLDAGPFLDSLSEMSGRVLIVDGQVVEADSDQVQLVRLADATDWETRVPVDHNKLAAAHTAFASDGIEVVFADNQVVGAPLVVEVQGSIEGVASFPHIAVSVGEHAEARVLVVYRSAEGKRLLMVPEVTLDVADGGNLRFLSVQSLDHAASNVVHLRVRIGRDATSRVGEVGLGGDLGRLDLGVSLEGDGASSDVVGLFFGEGSQTLDYRVVIDHVGRGTTSDVFLKGALEDDSQSVFTGLLRIEKDAEKTSTFETNRNLVLSDNAKAHSVPNLEILCNDVICGHASSVGPLEEDHVYYLQSRGLKKERAERLLIRGFFTEIIDRLPIDGLAGPISTEVFKRFVQAQEEGRLS